MRSTTIGIWLDAIPGLLGLFGIGEIYLGKRIVAAYFLMWTSVLYATILLAFAVPDFAFLGGYLPAAWALGYFLLLVDILLVTKNMPKESE